LSECDGDGQVAKRGKTANGLRDANRVKIKSKIRNRQQSGLIPGKKQRFFCRG